MNDDPTLATSVWLFSAARGTNSHESVPSGSFSAESARSCGHTDSGPSTLTSSRGLVSRCSRTRPQVRRRATRPVRSAAHGCSSAWQGRDGLCAAFGHKCGPPDRATCAFVAARPLLQLTDPTSGARGTFGAAGSAAWAVRHDVARGRHTYPMNIECRGYAFMSRRPSGVRRASIWCAPGSDAPVAAVNAYRTRRGYVELDRPALESTSPRGSAPSGVRLPSAATRRSPPALATGLTRRRFLGGCRRRPSPTRRCAPSGHPPGSPSLRSPRSSPRSAPCVPADPRAVHVAGAQPVRRRRSSSCRPTVRARVAFSCVLYSAPTAARGEWAVTAARHIPTRPGAVARLYDECAPVALRPPPAGRPGLSLPTIAPDGRLALISSPTGWAVDFASTHRAVDGRGHATSAPSRSALQP